MQCFMIDRGGISLDIHFLDAVVDKRFESDNIILNFRDPVIDGPRRSIGTKLILNVMNGIGIRLDLDIGRIDPT